MRLTLVNGYIVQLPCSCVSGLPLVSSKSSDEEREVFLARVEWLPVTFRSHTVTDGQMYNDTACETPSLMCAILQIGF